MSRPMYYKLVDRVAVPCDDIIEWAQWFEGSDRIVAQTDVPPQYFVSTAFLGIDHSFGRGPPLLFETMIFDRGDLIAIGRRGTVAHRATDYQTRCSTWAEAEAMHARAVYMMTERAAAHDSGDNETREA
jgi:hypothetical protein